MKIYLAGAINGCTDEECKDWREYVKSKVPKGIECLDPMARDYRGEEYDHLVVQEIVEGDKLDILSCDVVVVNYEKPSVGTSMEVLFAWEQHKEVYVVCSKDTPLSPWLTYHSTGYFNTFDDLIKTLKSDMTFYG